MQAIILEILLGQMLLTTVTAIWMKVEKLFGFWRM